VTETVFDGGIDEAERKLFASGEHALIDSLEINMSAELQAIATRVVEVSASSAIVSWPRRRLTSHMSVLGSSIRTARD
jgi:hypothetical protein